MADVSVDKKALVEGERPIFNASYGKLMMWFFLVSDAFTFSALLIAYGALRSSSVSEGLAWAKPENVFTHFPLAYEIWHLHWPLVFVGLMTFVLILSSVTMVLAVEAGHRKSKKEVSKWVLLTILGGATFLSCQAYEWYHFINGNPDGGYLVNVNSLNGIKVPALDELSLVALTPEHEGESHEHGAVTALKTLDGTSITNPEHIKAILKKASHWHSGVFVLSAVDARKLNISGLTKTVSVQVYPVKDTEGKIVGIRLNNGFPITGEDVVTPIVQSGSSTDGGANLKVNEYGPPAFADLFFFVTGFHGTHVFSGVILLVILYLNVNKGTYERRGHYEMTEKIGLYWHFVDLVWVFVFTFFYLV
ncbi:MAG: cytochrome c oxidase subunit 3 [Bacteroidia bacterium]